MPTANKVFLMGNLTRDPEVRTLSSGSTVCEFGLAVNDVFTNKQTGQREQRANFVDCVAWGKDAESIQKYFKKGRPIFIEGRLRFEQWNDRESGQKRSKLRVVVGTWQFVDSRNQDDVQPEHVVASQGAHQPLDDDQIPF